MNKKKKEPFFSKRDKKMILGWMFLFGFPMFIYDFINTEFLPISEETFIGAWLGSIIRYCNNKRI